MRWLVVIATAVACGGPGTADPQPPENHNESVDPQEKPAWKPKELCVDLHSKDIDALESPTAAEVIELARADAEALAKTLDADDPPEVIEAVRLRELVAALVAVCPDTGACTARAVTAIGSYDPAATADDDDDPGPVRFEVRANIELAGANPDNSAIDIGDFDDDNRYELILLRGDDKTGGSLELYAFPSLERLWVRPPAPASCDQAVIGWKDVNCDNAADMLVELSCAVSETELEIKREAWSLAPSRDTYVVAGSQSTRVPAPKRDSTAVAVTTGCTGTWALELTGDPAEPECAAAAARVEFLLSGRSSSRSTFHVLSGTPGKPSVLQAARVGPDCFVKVSNGNADPNQRVLQDYRLSLRMNRKKIIGDGWYAFQKRGAPNGIVQVCNVAAKGTLR